MLQTLHSSSLCNPSSLLLIPRQPLHPLLSTGSIRCPLLPHTHQRQRHRQRKRKHHIRHQQPPHHLRLITSRHPDILLTAHNVRQEIARRRLTRAGKLGPGVLAGFVVARRALELGAVHGDKDEGGEGGEEGAEGEERDCEGCPEGRRGLCLLWKGASAMFSRYNNVM